MIGKENSLELVPYAEERRDLWDGAVLGSRNGTFLHRRGYLDYHADRFDEQSVLVLKQGKAVGVFPCNRVDDRIVSHGGLTYGGLLYGRDLRAGEVLRVFDLLGEHFRSLGARSIFYKAVPHLFHNYPAEEDLYALFRLGAHLYRRDISAAVRLDDRIRFSDSRKCTIRKSAKSGVAIREGEFFPQYHELLSRAISKFGAEPVHSPDELLLLKGRFPEQIRLFGAFDGEELLAGALTYDFGNTVHTQYLASSDKGRELGALDFVLAHLIEERFADRGYFSFGISTEQEGRYLNESLIFQKEGFGARGVVHDFYRWDLA